MVMSTKAAERKVILDLTDLLKKNGEICSVVIFY